MAYRLIVTQSAEADLTSIVAYLVSELYNPDAAANLLDEIEKRYAVLEENPFLYARCTHPLLLPGEYRKVVIGSYLLIYHVEEFSGVVYVDRFFNELQDYADKL